MKTVKPLFQYSEFQVEHSLSQELPYWDFSEDPVPGISVLSDGSLVKGLSLTGLSIETWDTNQVNQLTTGFRSLLNTLPDGSDFQFFVDVNSDFSQLVSAHKAIKGSDPLIAWITEDRTASLQHAIDAQQLQKTHLYLFVYLRAQASQGKIASFFAKPRRFEWARKEEFERRAKELSQLCLSVQGALDSVGVVSRPLA